MTQAFKLAFGVLCLLAPLAAAPARAAEEPAAQTYVLLVGVDQFADQHIKARPHAEADAQALYDVFVNKAYLGLDDKHIKLLLGKEDNEEKHSEAATRDNVLKALHWLATKPNKADLVILGFFTQGAPLGERVCYFTADSTFKDRAKNAVTAAEIEHELERMKSQNFCAFLDVNLKGYELGKDQKSPDLNLNNLYKEFLGKDDENTQIGRSLFLANSGQKPSLELEKHGLFAQAMLDGLKGAADTQGYEPDGLVVVDELADYLEKAGSDLARKYGKTKEEKAQYIIAFHTSGMHSVLTRNPAVAAKVAERLAKFAKLAQNKELSKERLAQLLDEGQRLLSQMPKLEAYRMLRKKYQELADGKVTLTEFDKARKKILDGMKYSRDEAADFAAKIIRATQQIGNDYVKETKQGEMVAWAIRGLFQAIDEKLPKDVKDRLDKLKDMKEQDLTNLLADIRERLGKREDLDNHKDIDLTLKHMLRHLDPYTTYVDPEMLERFKQETDANFTGIGIQITKDTDRDMLKVISPIKDSPAYKAGVQAGDVITSIKREVDSEGKKLDKPDIISTKGLAIGDAVKKILGKPKTKVKITVDREGVDHPLEFEIARAIIQVETVTGVKRKSDDTWDYMLDPKTRIAYIRLASFAQKTDEDLARVLHHLDPKKGDLDKKQARDPEKTGIKGLILDLRFNPGGLLGSAVFVSDLFIDDGRIVSIRPRAGKEYKYDGESANSYTNFPMVVLVNGSSASGAEIVAACLQDHGRAKIMGTRSYGKGSVQSISNFAGGKLKMTTASYWRPSGKNINKSSTGGKESDEWGVTPDKGYVLKLPGQEQEDLAKHLHDAEIIARKDVSPKEPKKEFKDRQLEMALEYLRKQIKVGKTATVANKAG